MTGDTLLKNVILPKSVHVIGVDPHSASLHAVAVSVGSSWEVKEMNLFELSSKIERYAGNLLVVIEDQFMMRHVGLKKLIQSAGQVQGVCVLAGARFEMINVAKWQGFFGLTGIIKKERAEAYIKKAGWYCPLTLNADTAVAVLLSVYARLNLTWGCKT